VQQDQRDFAEFYTATRDDCLRVVLLTAGGLRALPATVMDARGLRQ
jgi:hypothetical protein